MNAMYHSWPTQPSNFSVIALDQEILEWLASNDAACCCTMLISNPELLMHDKTRCAGLIHNLERLRRIALDVAEARHLTNYANSAIQTAYGYEPELEQKPIKPCMTTASYNYWRLVHAFLNGAVVTAFSIAIIFAATRIIIVLWRWLSTGG